MHHVDIIYHHSAEDDDEVVIDGWGYVGAVDESLLPEDLMMMLLFLWF